MNQAPRRTCVGCRKRRAKPDLLRLVTTPDGVVVDPEQHLPGRGAYVCPSTSCIAIVERAKGYPLRRALRDPDPTTIPQALSELRSWLGADEDPDGSTALGTTGVTGQPNKE